MKNKEAKSSLKYVFVSIILLLLVGVAVAYIGVGELADEEQTIGKNIIDGFKLEKISEVYSGIESGEVDLDDLVFLDENNQPIRVKSITTELSKGKFYDVDVENDIVLVSRNDGTLVWSGNSNNGTAVGNAYQTSAGKLGKGFEFDGDGDYVDLGDMNDVTEGITGLSISVWVKYAGNYLVVPEQNRILTKLAGGTDDVFTLRLLDTEDFSFIVYNSTDDIGTVDTLDLGDNDWHHLVATYNGTAVAIFMDGALAEAQPLSGPTATSPASIVIGAHSNGGSGYFNGTIDDVMIFNRSLSAAEIQALYANKSSEYLERNFTSLAEGSHTFKAYTQDLAGNVNETSERTATVDTTLPDINITSPSNNTNTTNIGLNVNYTASDINLAYCWYSNDTMSVNTTLTDCTTNITTVIWAEGEHNVTIWTNDSAGNENSSSVTFTIDTTPPNVNITYPLNTTYSSSSIDFNITLNEAGSCQYSLNNGATNYTMTANALNTGFNATNSSIADGSYTVIAYCNDTVGNTNHTENTTFTISTDTTSPDVTILSPLNQSYSTSSIDFNISANENLSYCKITLNDWTINYTMTLNSSLTGANYTNSSIGEGSYTALFWCNDTKNNINNSENVSFTIDTTTPNITLIAPADATSSTTTAYNFTFNVSDNSNVDNCSLIFDDNVINTITSVSKTSENGMYNSSLSVVTHTWSVNCTDALGNEGNSSSRSLIVSSAAVADTGGGSGGRGGGGTASPALSQAFDLDTNSLIIRGIVGEIKSREIKIKNTGKIEDEITIILEGEDIDKIVLLSRDSLVLEPKQSETVELKILVPEELGVYTGRIIFESRDIKKNVLVTINTQSEETLFDISVAIPESSVKKGDKVGAQVNLIPVGEKGVDVTLKYLIKNFKSKIYYEESETFYVDEQMSFTKEFETDKLIGGDYVLGIEMTYSGGFASASSQFSLPEPKFAFELKWDIRYLVIIIITIILILIAIDLVEIRKFRKGKMKRYKRGK